MNSSVFDKNICFIAFSAESASKIRQSLNEAGIREINVELSDEEYAGGLCSNLLKQGTKVFIYENESFEKPSEGIYVPLICKTADYMQVYISSDEINNILVLSDEPENINSKILSYYWNIIPSVVDAGMTPNKLRAFLKDAASSRAMCIGPSRFAMEAGLCGTRYKSVYPSKETICETIERARDILKTKRAETEKNKENLLRMEQYKVRSDSRTG